MKIILSSAAILLLDNIVLGLGHYSTQPFHTVTQLAYFLTFVVRPIPFIGFPFYIDYLLFHNENRIHRIRRPFVLLQILNIIILAESELRKQNSLSNVDNLLAPAFFIFGFIFSTACLAYGYILLLFNRKRLPRKTFVSLLFFILPLIFGDIVYLINHNIMVTAHSFTLSLLILFLSVQYNNSNTDYLTGLYNRRHCDEYLQQKIKNSSGVNTFSAMLLDINNFKHINDRNGHDMGDRALKEASAILRRTLRYDDFISRIGGDEFVAVINISDINSLEEMALRIKKATSDFNSVAKRPYKIQFSIGYAVFNPKQKVSSSEFLHLLDGLMYTDKKRSKQASLSTLHDKVSNE